MITHAKFPEFKLVRKDDRVTTTSEATGRYSMAIGGLTNTQVAVLEACLANLLCSQNEHLASSPGSDP